MMTYVIIGILIVILLLILVNVRIVPQSRAYEF